MQQAKGDLLNHAKAAVNRAAESLLDLRARLETPTACLGRQHRLIIEGAVHDLSRRHERLETLYQAMLDASPAELPASWRRFFACYDEYLEALRDAKCTVARDDLGGTLQGR